MLTDRFGGALAFAAHLEFDQAGTHGVGERGHRLGRTAAICKLGYPVVKMSGQMILVTLWGLA